MQTGFKLMIYKYERINKEDLQRFNDLYYQCKSFQKKWCEEQVDIISKYFKNNILKTLYDNKEFNFLNLLENNNELFDLIVKYLMEKRIKEKLGLFDYGKGGRFFRKVYEDQEKDINKFLKNFNKIVDSYIRNCKTNKEYVESLVLMLKLTA